MQSEAFVISALRHVYFPFLCWVKFCSGCFLRQAFFHLGDKIVVTGCVKQVVVLLDKHLFNASSDRFGLPNEEKPV